MQREPMVFFVAGMVFGCVLGYMLANLGSGDAPRPVSAATPAGGRSGGTGSGAAALSEDGHTHTAAPLDPNEVKALESLAARDKSNAQVRIELATLLMEHERYEDAARWWREVLALRPGEPDVLVDLGACLVNTGKAAEGLAQFEAALKKDPNHKKALFNKGVALMESGKPREAVAVWEDLLKRFPNDPQLAGLRNQIEQVRAQSKAS